MERFGRLVVVKPAGKLNGRAAVECLCDCGATKTVQVRKLRDGTTSSCGCLRKEVMSKNGKKVGDANARKWRGRDPNRYTLEDL